MRGMLAVLAVVVSMSAAAASAEDVRLPSHDVVVPPFITREIEPMSFDLLDVRADAAARRLAAVDNAPHTMFIVKKHIGIGAGYDNQVIHGSLGLYITVAEWGRWNLGVPGVELGFGRYPVYDAKLKQAVKQGEPTLLFSIASIHYRAGYLQSFGMNWYLNFEQVFDTRTNMTGSQLGISFSRK